MTRGPAQAGNRAGETESCLQWWDAEPECHSAGSATEMRCNCTRFCLLGWPSLGFHKGKLGVLGWVGLCWQRGRLWIVLLGCSIVLESKLFLEVY